MDEQMEYDVMKLRLLREEMEEILGRTEKMIEENAEKQKAVPALHDGEEQSEDRDTYPEIAALCMGFRELTEDMRAAEALMKKNDKKLSTMVEGLKV